MSGSEKFFLNVPFEEKEQAKWMGAKWSSNDRLWYVERVGHPATLRWPGLLTVFPGEDRTFGGKELFVDLIPKSCWFTNARSALLAQSWMRVRAGVGGRVDWRCETCGEQGEHIHERWNYDELSKTQSLRRLICLCAACHLSTHFGFAEVIGKEKGALAHLCRVNRWTEEQGRAHVKDAFNVWKERNNFDWKLDLDILVGAGLEVKPPVAATERVKVTQGWHI